MQKRRRRRALSLSAWMTLVVLFHPLRFRQFKRFYGAYVCRHRRAAFPTLPSYHRGVEWLPRCAAPVAAWFAALKGACTGSSIVDATSLAVCDTRRRAPHRGFQGSAARGKTSMGWFYGFKLHAIMNSHGERSRLTLTPGNVDDRKPLLKRCQGLFGCLFADKGYIAHRLPRQWAGQDIQRITTLRKHMKPGSRTDFEKALLRRRCLLETVFDELKNLCQIEHTRHRSIGNFLVKLMAGIVAYCLSDHKPTLTLMRVHALAAP